MTEELNPVDEMKLFMCHSILFHCHICLVLPHYCLLNEEYLLLFTISRNLIAKRDFSRFVFKRYLESPILLREPLDGDPFYPSIECFFYVESPLNIL